MSNRDPSRDAYQRVDPATGRLVWVYPNKQKSSNKRTRMETDDEVRARHFKITGATGLQEFSGPALDHRLKELQFPGRLTIEEDA